MQPHVALGIIQKVFGGTIVYNTYEDSRAKVNPRVVWFGEHFTLRCYLVDGKYMFVFDPIAPDTFKLFHVNIRTDELAGLLFTYSESEDFKTDFFNNCINNPC